MKGNDGYTESWWSEPHVAKYQLLGNKSRRYQKKILQNYGEAFQCSCFITLSEWPQNIMALQRMLFLITVATKCMNGSITRQMVVIFSHLVITAFHSMLSILLSHKYSVFPHSVWLTLQLSVTESMSACIVNVFCVHEYYLWKFMANN